MLSNIEGIFYIYFIVELKMKKKKLDLSLNNHVVEDRLVEDGFLSLLW